MELSADAHLAEGRLRRLMSTLNKVNKYFDLAHEGLYSHRSS